MANDQRKVVYEQRRDLMQSEDISENLVAIREDVTDNIISDYLAPGSMEEQWDIDGLSQALENEFGLSLPVKQWLDEDEKIAEEEVREKIHQRTAKLFKEKEDRVGPENSCAVLKKISC